MDAVDYLKTLRRICKEFNPVCPDCPAFPLCGASGDHIQFATPEKITKAVEDVESWKKEHPAKTRQSEFLKLIPNAKITNGSINVYPCLIDHLYDEMYMGECNDENCDQCRKEYWLEEIE